MSCVTPISIKQKHGRVTVPCGKCYGCLKRKRSGWLLRLENEQKVSNRSLFVTLTYADEFLPHDNQGNTCFDKSHLQKYFKRLRKNGGFRYYAVAEYGGRRGRPHYHLLLFNVGVSLENIVSKWKYGHVHVGDVTSASINYCAAYVITKEHFKYDNDDPRKPFALMSRKPGIGSNYVERFKKYHRDGKKSFGVRQFGQKVPLPRYYSEKIFTTIERQIIGKIHRTEAEIRGTDQVLNVEDWKLKNPDSTMRDYFVYRQQIIEDRNKQVFKTLKQIRDGKDF